ncbi:MAG: ABC transporter permease [Myxococcales bacterium]|nr:ABC transporter permease [Myxococcales bacterium]
MTRMLAVAKKELHQLKRDRLTLAMMVVLPLMQLLLFGWAINTDVRNVPVVIYDQDGSRQARELVRSMENTGFYRIVGNVESFHEIELAMQKGLARAALVVPSRYASSLTTGSTATLEFIVDGSDPMTVGSAMNTLASLVAARSFELVTTRMMRSGSSLVREPVRLETNTWYNPELKTAVYVVPGLVGVILTMTMVMLTAMGIARERERGTLEQLIVSPLRRTELVIGKILPYVIIGYVQMSLILLTGHVAFGVPIVGSLPLLYLLAFVFISANLALGLFFSTHAKTQQQAMQMSFFFILPNILLSGFMFPFEGMPRGAQVLAQGLPLTHFLRIVRGILLRGAKFQDIRMELVWLVGILAMLITITTLSFRKKLV